MGYWEEFDKKIEAQNKKNNPHNMDYFYQHDYISHNGVFSHRVQQGCESRNNNRNQYRVQRKCLASSHFTL